MMSKNKGKKQSCLWPEIIIKRNKRAIFFKFMRHTVNHTLKSQLSTTVNNNIKYFHMYIYCIVYWPFKN